MKTEDKKMKTKILITYGPASDSREVIEKMMDLGVRCFRFNMKHNQPEWHEEKMKFLRKIAEERGHSICIVMDLQGPEIRAVSKKVFEAGDEVMLGSDKNSDIILDREQVVADLRKGNDLYIDDGRLRFKVIDKKKGKAKLRVIEGGKIEGRKSVNFPGVDLNIKSIAARDIDALSKVNRVDVDYVALSFVRDEKDILDLQRELDKRGMNAGIISKVETQQALDNIDEVLEASDAIMIARGDLGIETPMEEIPYWQKTIINKCLQAGKPAITATQMLESMVDNPLPTRAEISDVGNAILDESDAIMLSGESAMGKYPVEAVNWMVRSAIFLEDNQELDWLACDSICIDCQTASITKSAYELAESMPEVKGFLVLTEGGFTARNLARLRPKKPIYAFTHNRSTRDKMHLVWGVYPYLFDYQKLSNKEIKRAVDFLHEKEKDIRKGDKIIMVCGSQWGVPGKTNMVRLIEV
jgi:pyruvate kinase